MRITWLGHATVVIEMDGARVVTDPVLAAVVGHLRRIAARGASLGRADAVLVSHLHRDHADLRTLRRIDPDVPVLAPSGSLPLLRRAARRRFVGMRPGDAERVGPLRVTATPAVHDGGRARRGAGSWRSPPVEALGFLVEGDAGVAYFAGDTDLFPEMERLTGRLDVALVPVGGWHPRLGPGHLDAEGAAEALALLRPRVAIPIHWGTYAPPGMRRGAAHLREQGERLRDAARRRAPGVSVRVLAPGESTEVAPRGATAPA